MGKTGLMTGMKWRRNQKNLTHLITEKKEEKIEEVDLLFAEVVDESEGKDINADDFFNQRFTPMCTPTKNRKELLDCEEGEWDPEWDEETNDDHPNIKKEHTLMYV